jgi:hypothetical protein
MWGSLSIDPQTCSRLSYHSRSVYIRRLDDEWLFSNPIDDVPATDMQCATESGAGRCSSGAATDTVNSMKQFGRTISKRYVSRHCWLISGGGNRKIRMTLPVRCDLIYITV